MYHQAVEKLRLRQRIGLYFKTPVKHPYLDQNVKSADANFRMRIAIVTETWPPEINGVAHSLLKLCQGLQAKGHQILLIRPEQRNQCADFHPEATCLVRSNRLPRYPELRFGWPQWLKVSLALADFKPDVVHIVTEGPLGFIAMHAARTHKLPVSSGFHSPFQEFSRFFDLACLLEPIQHYLRWFHNHTDLTIVPSTDTARALVQSGLRCPIHVVGRGVDTQQFSPEHRQAAQRLRWGADLKTTVLLYVGRLSPEKEVDQIILAYKALKKTKPQDFKLVIVGDGPDRLRLEQLAANTDVVFTGSLTGQALSVAYASADVFVFASQVETFGNVVLEAMASGLAIVAYDYACAARYVVQGKHGYLTPLGNNRQFLSTVQNLTATEQIKQMGQAARQQVNHCGWQQAVNEMEYALGLICKTKIAQQSRS